MRRLSDEPPTELDDAAHRADGDKIRAIVSQLTGYAIRDAADTKGIVRGLYRLLSNYQDEINGLDDPTITAIWLSALQYIEGIGMTSSYDPDVVLRHFESISVVTEIPKADVMHRQALVKDLNKLVKKKIHSIEANVRGRAANW